jgi:hypothetical protein
MATIPQSNDLKHESETKDAYELKPDHRLAGYTVDRLLEEGKIDQARDELEMLLRDGINSGPGRPMTDDLMEEIMTKARLRVRQVPQ